MMTDVGALSDAELTRLRLPTWLAGGSPLEFGRMCRWRMEAADLAGGEWDVRLDERVKRKPTRIVQASRGGQERLTGSSPRSQTQCGTSRTAGRTA